MPLLLSPRASSFTFNGRASSLAESLSPLVILIRGNRDSLGQAAHPFALPQDTWCGAGRKL